MLLKNTLRSPGIDTSSVCWCKKGIGKAKSKPGEVLTLASEVRNLVRR